jgi:hypothetical protein
MFISSPSKSALYGGVLKYGVIKALPPHARELTRKGSAGKLEQNKHMKTQDFASTYLSRASALPDGSSYSFCAD